MRKGNGLWQSDSDKPIMKGGQGHWWPVSRHDNLGIDLSNCGSNDGQSGSECLSSENFNKASPRIKRWDANVDTFDINKVSENVGTLRKKTPPSLFFGNFNLSLPNNQTEEPGSQSINATHYDNHIQTQLRLSLIWRIWALVLNHLAAAAAAQGHVEGGGASGRRAGNFPDHSSKPFITCGHCESFFW